MTSLVSVAHRFLGKRSLSFLAKIVILGYRKEVNWLDLIVLLNIAILEIAPLRNDLARLRELFAKLHWFR